MQLSFHSIIHVVVWNLSHIHMVDLIPGRLNNEEKQIRIMTITEQLIMTWTKYIDGLQKNKFHINFGTNTSMEHLTSSTVGQIMWGFPIPSGDLSLETPEDMDTVNSDSHFSSREPREENCNTKMTCYISVRNPPRLPSTS